MTLTRTQFAKLAGQVIRYGTSGLGLAALYSCVYLLLAQTMKMPPQFANVMASVANLFAGWWLHSRWSFRELDVAGPRHFAFLRFFTVNLLGIALNCLWVWAIVNCAGWPAEYVLAPVLLLTPAINFCLIRLWIFHVAAEPVPISSSIVRDTAEM